MTLEKRIKYLYCLSINDTQNLIAPKVHAILTASKAKNSFILNPKPLLLNEENASYLEQLVYLELLSLRDAQDYLRSNTVGLPTWKVHNTYKINELKTNRLLTILNDSIYFLYEGDYENGTII
jgi:hypothetical protein